MSRVRPAGDTHRPQVSVVLPTYRGADRIRACLDSLLRQTLDPAALEVLVVVNGPDDGTWDLVDVYRREHPELLVRPIRSLAAGAARARNLGLAAVRGDYVTFLDDDDVLTPSCLADMLDLADAGSVVMVPLVDRDDVTGETRPDTVFTRRLLALRGEDVVWSSQPGLLSLNACKLVPAEVATAAAYDESLPSGEDVVYWHTLVSARELRVRVVDPLTGSAYVRSVRDGSVSRRPHDFGFSVVERLATIRALGRLTSGDHPAASAARSAVRAQIGHVNRYLLAAPDDLGRVLDEVRAARPAYFHYPSLTAGLARDLAVPYAFVPYADTSAIVFARRLQEACLPVDVVTMDLSGHRSVDPSSARLVAGLVDRMVVVKGRAGFGRWNAATEFSRTALEEVERLVADKGVPYRSVLSRAMWPASHVLAALVKLRWPETRWVAEFSDPVSRDVHGEVRVASTNPNELLAELTAAMRAVDPSVPECENMYELCELVAYALADEVRFTNENQREYMLGYCEVPVLVDRARARSTVDHHPVPPQWMYDLDPEPLTLDPTKVNLGYFGAFYPNRGLSEVLDAMHELQREGAHDVVLHAFTSTSADDVAQWLHEGSESVVLHPSLPYTRFLSVLPQFDCLLVSDTDSAGAKGINPYLPSKYGDYSGAGAAIWSIVDDGSVLSTLPAAHRTPLGDVPAAVEVLRTLVERQRARRR